MPNNKLCNVNSGICTPIVADEKHVMQKKEEAISRAKLIYFYDPLCGWCFGFSPVMSEIQDAYGDKLDIEVISGGLFLDLRAGAVNTVAPHIKSGAYKSVELQTRVMFGKPFLDNVFGDGTLVLNSLPPVIALSIVREVYPEHELKFASLLLELVYVFGKDPTDTMELAVCATKIGFDTAGFETKMKDPKYENAAREEFEAFKNHPYSAMPSVVLVHNGKEHLISRGYMNFEDLKNRLAPFLD